MIVPPLADGKLFVPKAFEVWLEFGKELGWPKALFDGVEGLRIIDQQI